MRQSILAAAGELGSTPGALDLAKLQAMVAQAENAKAMVQTAWANQ